MGLTVVFESYDKKIFPDLITDKNEFQLDFDSVIFNVETDEKKADRVERNIINKIGNDGFYEFIQAFAADEPEKEMTVYRYFALLFKYGERVKTMFNHPYVIAYNDMCHRVTYESHRFCGFLRFRELNNFELAGWKTEDKIYYAPYFPDHNITPFIMDYFARRNQDMKMIIHDTKRNIFGIYDTQNWDVFVLDAPVVVEPSEYEIMFQTLWKQYYSVVSIDSRKNTRLMNQFLPVRYRRFLNEFSYVKF
ncbi:MAG: hypothetical protein K0S55_1143 [Clostridia bacterium]|nr:hypothetical protein [Clostridia bacterium]